LSVVYIVYWFGTDWNNNIVIDSATNKWRQLRLLGQHVCTPNAWILKLKLCNCEKMLKFNQYSEVLFSQGSCIHGGQKR